MSPFLQISVGKEHAVALTEGGRVFATLPQISDVARVSKFHQVSPSFPQLSRSWYWGLGQEWLWSARNRWRGLPATKYTSIQKQGWIVHLTFVEENRALPSHLPQVRGILSSCHLLPLIWTRTWKIKVHRASIRDLHFPNRCWRLAEL